MANRTSITEKTNKKTKKQPHINARLNKGKLAEKYEIYERLGKGNFAVVRRVKHKETGRLYAAKIIAKKNMTEEDKRECEKEASILSKLNHPNIVHMVEVIRTTNHLYMVLELLTGGELFERIINYERFTEFEVSSIAYQLASALQHMHANKVVHRDLKPENILYANSKRNSLVKITDFGLAKDHSGQKSALKTRCGTPGYVAPELLAKTEYTHLVDLWSLGVVVYYLLCGYPPFGGAVRGNFKAMYRKIRKGAYSFPSPEWDDISNNAKDCVSGLLTVDPNHRMEAHEVTDHPWTQQSLYKDENQRLAKQKGAKTAQHGKDKKDKMKLDEKGNDDEDEEEKEEAGKDGSQTGKNIATKTYQRKLAMARFRKRFRRTIVLVILMNRFIAAGDFEHVARQQREAHFKERQKEKWVEESNRISENMSHKKKIFRKKYSLRGPGFVKKLYEQLESGKQVQVEEYGLFKSHSLN